MANANGQCYQERKVGWYNMTVSNVVDLLQNGISQETTRYLAICPGLVILGIDKLGGRGPC